MAEEIGFENGRNSNFQGLVTLTLTLDPVIWHTVVHHSSTSTYIPNFIEIEETFCGRTDGRTDIFSPSNIIRSTFGSRPKKADKLAVNGSNAIVFVVTVTLVLSFPSVINCWYDSTFTYVLMTILGTIQQHSFWRSVSRITSVTQYQHLKPSQVLLCDIRLP